MPEIDRLFEAYKKIPSKKKLPVKEEDVDVNSSKE